MTIVDESWWIASLGKTLVWARLRIRDSGVAEVFDCDGRTQIYDSDDSARAALMDAEFRAFDGLDDDDARTLGFSLGAIAPPEPVGDEALRDRMIQSLPTLQ